MSRLRSQVWWTFLTLLTALSLQAVGCSARDKKTQEKPEAIVLATVASQRITKADFVRRLDAVAPALRERYVRDPKLLEQVLMQMVDELVLVADARKRGSLHGAKVTPATMLQLRQQLEGRVLKQLRTYRAPVDEERAYFEKHRSRFIVPLQIAARHVLVPTRALAEKVASEVKAVDDLHGHGEGGTNFAELVKKYSIDADTKLRGGGLGAFSAPTPQVDQAVFVAALKLKKRFEVSPPVQSPKGWHVIQLTQRQEGQDLTLEQARSTIQLLLRQQRGATLVAAAMAGLRTTYGVRVHLGRLGKLPPPPATSTAPSASSAR